MKEGEKASEKVSEWASERERERAGKQERESEGENEREREHKGEKGSEKVVVGGGLQNSLKANEHVHGKPPKCIKMLKWRNMAGPV